MAIGRLLSRWFQPSPLEVCPSCGQRARVHDLRILARERFSPGPSGVEALLAGRDFARAAALHDRRILGDQLVHAVIRCGDKAIVVTTEEPVGFGLETRVRGTLLLEGEDAASAWNHARRR